MKKVIKKYSNFINESEVKTGQKLPEKQNIKEEDLEEDGPDDEDHDEEDHDEELVELVREFNTLLKRYIKTKGIKNGYK